MNSPSIYHTIYHIISKKRFLEYSWYFLKSFIFLLLTINRRAKSWHSIEIPKPNRKPPRRSLRPGEGKKRSRKAPPSKKKPPSALFRGDVGYKRGDPVGHEPNPLLSDDERAKKAYNHVLNEIGGYFTSFTGSTRIALKFTDHKEKYTIKVMLKNIKKLEAEGIICIYEPKDVAELIKKHPKNKISRKANDVKKRMKDNEEILIEGIIPAKYVEKVRYSS